MIWCGDGIKSLRLRWLLAVKRRCPTNFRSWCRCNRWQSAGPTITDVAGQLLTSAGSLAHLIAPKSIQHKSIIWYLFSNWCECLLYFLYCSALVGATRIAAGEHSLSTTSGFEQFSDVEMFVMHPNYDTWVLWRIFYIWHIWLKLNYFTRVTLENDIVLIKVI